MQRNNIQSKISALLSATCLCLFFLACSSDSTTTDGNIVGTVISSRTNEPLQGVLVTLMNTGKSMTTGTDGHYQFTNLTSQDYTVQVSKENYTTDSKQVFVRAGEDNKLDFSMQPSTGALEVSRNQLDFGTESTNLSFTIKNTGSAVINWQSREDADWLSCSPASGSIHAGESQSVTVNVTRSGKAKGTYSQTIAVTSNGGSADIVVNMSIAGLKDVLVEPSELDFGTTTTSLQLSMKNTGTGAVSYAIVPSNDWIKPGRTSGNFTQNEIVTIAVDRLQLAAGEYSGMITIKVADQTQDVPIRMTILQKSVPTVALYTVDDVTNYSAMFRGAVVDIGSSKVMYHGFCWSTQEHPDISLETKCNLGDCSAAKDISYTATSLKPGTQYYVRAYAENSLGVAYSDEITFMTVNTSQKPTVETGNVLNVTTDGAQVSGNVINVGHKDGVAQYGHVWNTKTNPTVDNQKTQLGKVDAATAFVSTLTNLVPGQTYYVRAYATNSIGTAYGEEVMFTTAAGDVTLTTTSATNVTSDGATIGGSISSLGGNEISERGVCWATTSNPTVSGNHETSSSTSNSFSVQLTNLSENTTYHARAYVKTKENKVFYGNEVTFTTSKSIKAASVGETTISDIKNSEATFASSITSNGGGTISDCGFCYSTNQNPTISSTKLSCGKQTGSFSTKATGLKLKTTYYVRAYVVNEAGTSYGKETSFTTAAGDVTLTTTSAINVTSDGATIGGSISSLGGNEISERGVCWATTSNPTVSGNHETSSSTSNSFSVQLTNLSENTTYHARAYVKTKENKVFYGNEVTFTTSKSIKAASVGETTISDIKNSEATFASSITSNGGGTISDCGFYYSTKSKPTSSDQKVSCGKKTGTFSTKVTGLSENTTYYVRAYVENEVGVSIGSEATFTTPKKNENSVNKETYDDDEDWN